MSSEKRAGLTLGYRITWALRYAAVTVFGPAQLGAEDDPQMRLRREWRERAEAGRRADRS